MNQAQQQQWAQHFWANKPAQADYPRARAAGYGSPAQGITKGKGVVKQQYKGGGKNGRGKGNFTAPPAAIPSRFKTFGVDRPRQGLSLPARPPPAQRPQSFQTFMQGRYVEARPKSQSLGTRRVVTPVAAQPPRQFADLPHGLTAKVDTAPLKTRRLIGLMQLKVNQKISKLLKGQEGKPTPELPSPKKKVKGKGKGKEKGKAAKGKGKKKDGEVKKDEVAQASNPFEVPVVAKPMEVEETNGTAPSSKGPAVGNLDKPLSQIIAEIMPDVSKDVKENPPPYPAPQLEAKGKTQYVQGEFTCEQFDALDELQEMIEHHIDDDGHRRITQSDLLTYSQRLMTIANMVGRT